MVGEALGNQGVTQVMGGMGSLGGALLSAAKTQGVEVRLDSTVRKIVKTEDRVTGVELASGDVIEATAVVSSADPTTTYRDLLGYRHIEAGQARRVEQYRTRSGTGKLHIALSGLPRFTGVASEELDQRLVIAPSMDAMETGLNPMKYHELTTQHVFDISIPTLEDPTLAPTGQHLLTALVHYVPYALKTSWEDAREELLESLISQLEAYAPGLRELIVASEVRVPEDFEASHGITGGNWHHGELSIDQALMMRPFPGSTQYKASVEGLYLCGAGSHPGGSLMGLAGRNAAQEILKQEVLK
jgi:phytoene dehydrogenase-like protein